jgi:mannose-6-phosphate isomerase-like protein (cupin superfamily)
METMISIDTSMTYTIGDRDVRPWGQWAVIAAGCGYICKEITVLPGEILSLQSHKHRSEHWYILEGSADIVLGGTERRLLENDSVFIPVGTKHRIANKGSSLLRFVEIQTGTHLDEDDIERFVDRFGR